MKILFGRGGNPHLIFPLVFSIAQVFVPKRNQQRRVHGIACSAVATYGAKEKSKKFRAEHENCHRNNTRAIHSKNKRRFRVTVRYWPGYYPLPGKAGGVERRGGDLESGNEKLNFLLRFPARKEFWRSHVDGCWGLWEGTWREWESARGGIDMGTTLDVKIKRANKVYHCGVSSCGESGREESARVKGEAREASDWLGKLLVCLRRQWGECLLKSKSHWTGGRLYCCMFGDYKLSVPWVWRSCLVLHYFLPYNFRLGWVLYGQDCSREGGGESVDT